MAHIAENEDGRSMFFPIGALKITGRYPYNSRRRAGNASLPAWAGVPYPPALRRWIARALCIALLSAAVFLCSTTVAWTAPSTDEKRLEDIMEGFEEDDSATDDALEGFDATPAAPAPSHEEKEWPLTVDGYAKLGLTYNYAHGAPEAGDFDYRGLSRLRAETRLDAQFKPRENWRALAGGRAFYDAAYALRTRDEVSDEVLASYESEIEWHEVYLRGRLTRHWDVKLGRQIVVWGRSDSIRVTDVLNPLDFREPGLTDIEDLRLPVTMSRLDGYWGSWNLSGIALHEIRFNKNPVYGNDFFPAPTPVPDEKTPTWWGADSEWALAVNGVFSGWDVSLYWAELYDESTHVVMRSNGALQRRHARIRMHGAAGALALGNWLLKCEAAYFTGLKFSNSDDTTHERIDGLLALEYSGWDDTSVSWEWAMRQLVDFADALGRSPDFAQEDQMIQALRYSRDFNNQTVNFTLLALIYGPLGQDGALERLTVAYDWSDAWALTAGIVLYQSGDAYLRQNIGDNDRIYAEIKYSF